MVGEYSIRGGILDIFPAEAARPVRIELFGDHIESIRRFDVESQRSVMQDQRSHGAAAGGVSEVGGAVSRDRRSGGSVASPGDPFAGWEFAVPLVRPRNASLLSLARDAMVVLDEPEQIRGRGRALVEAPGQHPDRPVFELADANFLHVGRTARRASQRRASALRELDLDGQRRPPHRHPPADGLSRKHARWPSPKRATLVDQGNRVVFFAPIEWRTGAAGRHSSGIFGAVPVGPRRRTRRHRRYLAERAYLAGPVASTYLIKGVVRRGVDLSRIPHRRSRLGGSVRFLRSGRPARHYARGQLSAFAADLADLKPGDYVVHVTHGVGKFLGHARNRAGRAEGRLHAARIRRRRETLCPAHAHGPGAEISRRGRRRRRRSTGWAAPRGRHANRASKRKCATWPTSC